MAIPSFFTKSDLSMLTGVSRPVIDRWYSEGLPYERVGGSGKNGTMKTRPTDFIKWLSQRIEKRTIERLISAKQQGLIDADIGDDTRPPTLEEEKLRLITENANNRALQNAQLKRELGEIALFEQAFRRTIYQIRPAIMGLGGRTASALAEMTDPGEIKVYLIEECKRSIGLAIRAFEDGFDELFRMDAEGKEFVNPIKAEDMSIGERVPMQGSKNDAADKLHGVPTSYGKRNKADKIADKINGVPKNG